MVDLLEDLRIFVVDLRSDPVAFRQLTPHTRNPRRARKGHLLECKTRFPPGLGFSQTTAKDGWVLIRKYVVHTKQERLCLGLTRPGKLFKQPHEITVTLPRAQ